MGLLKLLKLDVENEGLGKQVLITTVGYVVCYLEPQMNKSIGSDVKTDSWYHGDCVSITPENEPDKFYCSVCKN